MTVAEADVQLDMVEFMPPLTNEYILYSLMLPGSTDMLLPELKKLNTELLSSRTVRSLEMALPARLLIAGLLQVRLKYSGVLYPTTFASANPCAK